MRRARAAGSACPCHETPAQHPTAGRLWNAAVEACGEPLRGGLRLEMLVRRAVVALRQRRALARLALPRRGPTASDASVEEARLDLLLDEVDRSLHPLLHRPRDLRLRRDGEEAPDVLEQGALRLGEIERIARETLHRLLARDEDPAARLELCLAIRVRIDHVLH